MNHAILGSGSKANSYIFSNGLSSCLIDNGYSFHQLNERAKKLNFDIKKIKFILVTHTHKDHIGGVKTCAKKLKIPIYLNKESDYNLYFKDDKIELRFIEPNKIYKHESFSFVSFETSHDARGSISYSLNFNGQTFTIITDTGKITKDMMYYAINSDILFLEANYNKELLKDGPYPLYLKKRIESTKGHLSNIDAISFLNLLSKRNSKIKLVYLCHMSEVNNNPDTLLQDIKKYSKFNFKFIVCPRDHMQQGLEIDDLLISSNVLNTNFLF